MLIRAHPQCAKPRLEFRGIIQMHCKCAAPGPLAQMGRGAPCAVQVCLPTFSSRFSTLNSLNLHSYFLKSLVSLVPSIPNTFNSKKSGITNPNNNRHSTTQPTGIQQCSLRTSLVSFYQFENH